MGGYPCEDIMGIAATEIGPKCFGTFEKQVPGHEETQPLGNSFPALVRIFLCTSVGPYL